MALELVCGADFWCNRHCRTSPVVLEGSWGQVWPKIDRKPAKKSEFQSANEPLRCAKQGSEHLQSRTLDVTKPYEFIAFGAMDVTKPYEFIGFGAL